MIERRNEPLSNHTTLGLGGPTTHLLEPVNATELCDAVRACDEANEPLLLLAGGSNLVVADEGFFGTTIHITEALGQVQWVDQGDSWRVVAQAGASWESLVAEAVARGAQGVECLAGIPGSVGATPIQNVGAYGQEVKSTIASVGVYDRALRNRKEFAAHECAFGYRSSVFRGNSRYVILTVTFVFKKAAESEPIRYAELSNALKIDQGARASLTLVRSTVISLRKNKGMVLDREDSDTRSAGSFFTNPRLGDTELAGLRLRVLQKFGPHTRAPEFSDGDKTKVAAAWLIEHAGFQKGYRMGACSISSKHSLALVNRGDGTTRELMALARVIAQKVEDTFGVTLSPEPILVGHAW